ncbi:DedD protein [Silvimonas terrae]|uniref:DedD protein n=1 Tax=Silvimonas terrae TaxID=300266 RepID=A0A840RD99_9NEIS|nr:SPOR domain-containing protein [Silvimonas terrae]MBB5190353.1 DedD protein [Silvimonas terrae]
MSDQLDPILHQAEQSRLKQQLAWRLGIAAGLIVIVLAAIWFLDHSQSGEPEPTIVAPRFALAASAIAAIKASAVASAVASAPVAASAPVIASAPAATPAPTTETPEPAPQQPVTTPVAAPVKAPGHAAPAPVNPPAGNTPAPAPAPKVAEPALNLPPPEKIVETPVAAGKFEVHAGNNGYTIQAGVFQHAANADKLLSQLQAAGVPAWLETRVQIGPFKNKADADAAIRKLRKLGIEPVVRENQ